MSREGERLLGSLGGRKEPGAGSILATEAVLADESGATPPPLVPESSRARILELEAQIAAMKLCKHKVVSRMYVSRPSEQSWYCDWCGQEFVPKEN